MNNRIRTALLAVAVLALAAIPAASQEKEKEPEKPSLLTPAHKLLGSLAGEFDTTTRMWFRPDAEAVESKSSVRRAALLDGLFLRENYEVKDSPYAHKGEITWGYDAATGKVQYVQLVSSAQKMHLYEGTWDEKAGAFTVRSAYKMTWQGVEYDVKTRIVLSVESADRQKLEMFSAYESSAGKIPEYREIEVVYTRRK